jgi:hypothetical protein
MPTVALGVSHILINQRPGVSPPILFGTDARFSSTGIILTGQVSLSASGNALHVPGNWWAGFIQVEWVETNWAYYRGKDKADGSLLVQMGRAPARLQPACRDTLDAPVRQPVNGIFYGPPNYVWPGTNNVRYQESAPQGNIPMTLNPRHRDFPVDQKPLVRRNARTGQVNFLNEVQLEFHFCTMLAARDPAGSFEILKHLYWNLRWQAKFEPSNFVMAAASPAGWKQPTVEARGTGASIGAVNDGRPMDVRFRAVVTALQASNCNAVANAAAQNPIIRESNQWDNFDVRR